jgi:hypothetical protein
MKKAGQTPPNETLLLYPDIVCGDSRAMASRSMAFTLAAALCTRANVLTASVGYLFLWACGTSCLHLTRSREEEAFPRH